MPLDATSATDLSHVDKIYQFRFDTVNEFESWKASFAEAILVSSPLAITEAQQLPGTGGMSSGASIFNGGAVGTTVNGSPSIVPGSASNKYTVTSTRK